MTPTRRNHHSNQRLSNTSKCSTCGKNGFRKPDSHGTDDLPELQTDPRNPVFVNHAMSLLSSVDVESLSKEAHACISASQLEAIWSMKAVLSSVLRSQSFSPDERANIMRETRASLLQDYHLPGSVFNGILSEPFESLDALTPLEYEILRWSPIWEGSDEDGLYGPGMAMIRFLVEHWRYSNVIDESKDSDGDLNEGVPDPCAALVKLVRRACLRRIDQTFFESSVTDEDVVNILFQRIVRIIWSRNTGAENEEPYINQRGGNIGARSFNVSVTTTPSLADRSVSASPPSTAGGRTGGDIEVGALISICNFADQLNAPQGGGTSDIIRGADPAELVWSRRRERDTAIRNRHVSGLRQHPYARCIVANGSRGDGPSAPVPPEPPSDPVNRARSDSSRWLLVDFIAVRRAWTLAIGRNAIQLSVHGQESLDKLRTNHSPELDYTNSWSDSMPIIQAEIRLVPAHPVRICCDGTSFDEHVFTFADMHIPSGALQKKHGRDGYTQTARISPCFSSDHPETRPQMDRKSLVRGFDDPRLLHGDELLLELRVRIQKSPVEPTSATPAATSRMPLDTSADYDESSWSAFPTPPMSESLFGVASVHSVDLASKSSCGSTDALTGSSWAEI